MSVCRVLRREIAGDVRREERKGERCAGWVVERGERVSIINNVSVLIVRIFASKIRKGGTYLLVWHLWTKVEEGSERGSRFVALRGTWIALR